MGLKCHFETRPAKLEMGTKNDLTFVSRVFSKLISYFFVLTRMDLFRLQILLKPSIYRFLSMLQECKSQLSFATKIALPHVAGGFAVSNNKLITTTSASTKTMMTTLPLTSKLIRKNAKRAAMFFRPLPVALACNVRKERKSRCAELAHPTFENANKMVSCGAKESKRRHPCESVCLCV